MSIIARSINNTPVYTHEEAHPHRIDIAAEAIKKMMVPSAPADPSNRSQTRICETIDLGHIIGSNHLVETDEDDVIFTLKRGERDYLSRMVLKETEPETKLTTVLFWDDENEHWVLWTNFEGEEGLPEPGCDRYNKAPAEFKAQCDAFWAHHALVPTEEELEQIEINNVSIALAICDMLVDEIDLEFRERSQVSCATRSDIINSWTKEVYYQDGSHKLDPINTIEDIQDEIDWHVEGYARHPDGYDY